MKVSLSVVIFKYFMKVYFWFKKRASIPLHPVCTLLLRAPDVCCVQGPWCVQLQPHGSAVLSSFKPGEGCVPDFARATQDYSSVIKFCTSCPNRITFSNIKFYMPLGPSGFRFCKKREKKNYLAFVPLINSVR
jgi:hypothetical protein